MRGRSPAFVVCLVLALWAQGARSAGFDWTPFREENVIHLVTHDEDGAVRETRVWVVVVEGSGFVRTNASHWLENIQRNPQVLVRVRGSDYLMRAEEVKDAALEDRIEEAFKEKYGLVQRMMSLFRFRDPTVLRLVPRTSAATVGPAAHGAT